jgi:hypothetical protein
MVLNESNFSPRILYSAKLFKIDGAIKIFHNTQKLKQYLTTNPPQQKSLQGILHTEDKSKQNHRRRKDKQSESSIDSTVHNQNLK